LTEQGRFSWASSVDDTADPLDPKLILMVLAGTFLLFVVPSAAEVINPFRWFTTLFHELGHALAVVLMGGEVVDLTINRRGGGLTQARVPNSLGVQIVVSSAGYLSSIFVGVGLLAATKYLRSGRVVLGVLAVIPLLVAVAWVPWSADFLASDAAVAASGSRAGDGRFTWLFAVVTSGVLAAIALATPVRVRQLIVVALAALLCWSAFGDLFTLVGFTLGARGHSDAEALAQRTFIPAAVWAFAWCLMAVAALWWALRSLLRTQI